MRQGHRRRAAHAAAARSGRDAATPARAAGDAIAYRFVDHAGEATLSSPRSTEAWRALAYPAKLVDPYTGLRGDEVLRVVELALADADVASYGTPHPIAPARARALRFDPVWNRTRAVYESKRALFAPGETRYVFHPPAAADGASCRRGWRCRRAAPTSSSSSRSTARRGCGALCRPRRRARGSR